MGVPALGIAYRIENVVHAILEQGPAAKAGLRAGDEVVAAKVIYPKDEQDRTREPETIEFGASKASWPALFTSFQTTPPGTTVEFKLKRSGAAEPIESAVEPTAIEGLFVAERGFNFRTIVRIRTAESFAEQLRFGWEEATDSLLMVYRFLQKMWEGQVPMTALGGPLTIAGAAGGAASQGLPSLLIFLTMLSANLAVINFLPIPLLDGGHMVFLAYEGIRGRPANERFVVAMHMIGFAFIVCLMLFVLGLDFGLIKRNF
jgi:regulator of sigma E protease